MCPLPWETCGDTACYLLISPERQPPRTWTASGRGEVGLVQLGKAHQKHAKRHFCPLHFLSAAPPSTTCDFFPAARAGTGTEPELRGWKATRSGTAAFSLFLDLFRCGGKRRSGSGAGCAAKAEVFPLSSLIFLPSSLHLSICPLLSISPFVSMFLGPCDFAKMHHQQRMAALGTDKELSDLLDFSAVRNAHYAPIVNMNAVNSFMKKIKAFVQRPLFTLMGWSPQNLHVLAFFQLFAPNLGVFVE